MKRITLYESIDGKQFGTPKEANDRDAFVQRIQDTIAPLGPMEDDQLPEEYVQHDPKTVAACWAALLTVLGYARDYDPARYGPGSIIGRLLSDRDDFTSRIGWRFLRIDDLGREWEQPYFARHPPTHPRCRRG